MWYLIQRRGIKPREEWTVNLDQHLAWMKKQHESGRILFSGPTPDRKLGIYVIRAESRAEAERIAASANDMKAMRRGPLVGIQLLCII